MKRIVGAAMVTAALTAPGFAADLGAHRYTKAPAVDKRFALDVSCPKKRRRTEVSAPINWQPGAIGRQIFSTILLLEMAEAAGLRLLSASSTLGVTRNGESSSVA